MCPAAIHLTHPSFNPSKNFPLDPAKSFKICFWIRRRGLVFISLVAFGFYVRTRFGTLEAWRCLVEGKLGNSLLKVLSFCYYWMAISCFAWVLLILPWLKLRRKQVVNQSWHLVNLASIEERLGEVFGNINSMHASNMVLFIFEVKQLFFFKQITYRQYLQNFFSPSKFV